MDSYEEVGKVAVPEDILKSLKNIVVGKCVGHFVL